MPCDKTQTEGGAELILCCLITQDWIHWHDSLFIFPSITQSLMSAAFFFFFYPRLCSLSPFTKYVNPICFSFFKFFYGFLSLFVFSARSDKRWLALSVFFFSKRVLSLVKSETLRFIFIMQLAAFCLLSVLPDEEVLVVWMGGWGEAGKSQSWLWGQVVAGDALGLQLSSVSSLMGSWLSFFGVFFLRSDPSLELSEGRLKIKKSLHFLV